jgi:NSS family neurotransmitter:Na+ symporter
VFYNNVISAPVEPIVWAFILLFGVMFMLLFGITEIVEKVSKVIMPTLFVILLGCGIYACTVTPGAAEGLKYYLLPAPENFSFKVFADAATQVLFSVGIGWGIFTTLGASLPDSNNLKSDALMVSIMDTFAAILAGFVVIPTAYGAGIELQAGPSLLFKVMTQIYGQLPGGRIIGSLFFVGVTFAVISSLFTFFEINVKTAEIKLGMGRKKAIIATGALIFVGNIFCSLGFGPMSDFKLPWPYVGEIAMYGLYDWFDCFTGYVLLPLGCLLTCLFVWKGWGFENYAKEIHKHDGNVKPLSKFDKSLILFAIPAFMVIVLLNVFGVLK